MTLYSIHRLIPITIVLYILTMAFIDNMPRIVQYHLHLIVGRFNTSYTLLLIGGLCILCYVAALCCGLIPREEFIDLKSDQKVVSLYHLITMMGGFADSSASLYLIYDIEVHGGRYFNSTDEIVCDEYCVTDYIFTKYDNGLAFCSCVGPIRQTIVVLAAIIGAIELSFLMDHLSSRINPKNIMAPLNYSVNGAVRAEWQDGALYWLDISLLSSIPLFAVYVVVLLMRSIANTDRCHKKVDVRVWRKIKLTNAVFDSMIKSKSTYSIYFLIQMALRDVGLNASLLYYYLTDEQDLTSIVVVLLTILHAFLKFIRIMLVMSNIDGEGIDTSLEMTEVIVESINWV